MKTAMPLLELDDDACCVPITRDVMSAADAARWASRFKAIGDPARLRLLSLVAAHADGEACVCDLTETIGLSQGTISHHLRILVDAGLLNRSKRGTWSYYSLIPGALDSLTSILTDHVNA